MTQRFLVAMVVAVTSVMSGGEWARGQTTGAVVYNFGTSAANGSPSSNSVPSLSSNSFSVANPLGGSLSTAAINSSSPSSGYAGASGAFNIGNAVNDAFTAPSNTTNFINNAPYFTVTLTPGSATSNLTLTGFSFGERSTATGAGNFVLRSSVDSFASDIASFTNARNGAYSLLVNNSLNTQLQIGTNATPVELRLYLFNGVSNANSGTINTRADDVTISLSFTPVPEPATVLAASSLVLAGVGSLRRRRKLAAAVIAA